MGNKMKGMKNTSKATQGYDGKYAYGQQYPIAQGQSGQYGLSGSAAPRYSGPSRSSPYENDMLLSNYTGWPVADIGRLRNEFSGYANPYGVIDREGFRRLYTASLLNKPWGAIEGEAELAFRMFDRNNTGGIDFNEYMIGCTHMGGTTQYSSPGYSNNYL